MHGHIPTSGVSGNSRGLTAYLDAAGDAEVRVLGESVMPVVDLCHPHQAGIGERHRHVLIPGINARYQRPVSTMAQRVTTKPFHVARMTGQVIVAGIDEAFASSGSSTVVFMVQFLTEARTRIGEKPIRARVWPR